MNPYGQVLAIVPARGGSKGIPRKNLVKFGGRPLVAISVDHAKAAARVDRVVVSTDDDEIALIARQAGAEVVCRPASISGDTATSESALIHTLDVLRDRHGYDPDLVVFLQATSPLRRGADIDRAIETLEQEGADSLFSASPMHGFVWRHDPDGSWKSFSYDYRNRQRRQDAPEDVVENGNIYIFRPSILRSTGNRLGGRIAVYRMSYTDSIQVDEPTDVEIIRRLMPAPEPGVMGDGLRSVRLLVLDCDGVLTDNRVSVSDDGRESVSFSRADGFGLARLGEAGVKIAVLSKETSPVVSARCRKLNILCIQGCDDKLPRLQELAKEAGYGSSEVAYVGNDLNDLECLQWVGLPIAVSDAVPEVRRAATFVTQRAGGQDAVREVCDLILRFRSEESHVHNGSNRKSVSR
jgi:YrbI family 3-deoxy-D-manno-octulosonate 8-phosphate phosphatase